MEELSQTQNLSNIQLELLKLYAIDIKESELLDIKKYLADYFAKKAVSEADAVWDAKGFDNDEMDRWLNEQ